jgi:hypothetical protein
VDNKKEKISPKEKLSEPVVAEAKSAEDKIIPKSEQKNMGIPTKDQVTFDFEDN